ncbi:ABC transporter permease [[Clostridium] polysaccharolyticum]|uniref:Putative ABC transport system permease protein n=1 Tax=[Clostridium] polysaccharolyticum TaxID=29364 RepID=A0A1I0AE61_9FIRM|nr:ABC transporter permease [[Clostridium] polysaccharolyticum]SES92489.1 putative ABC transport system permease protein [[Clostridium] polysaccharolyticum]
MVINKRICRNIKEHISFYISAFLLTALSVILLIILTTVGHMIQNEVSSVMKANNVEDAEFITKIPISEEEISQLENQFNLSLEEISYADYEGKNATIRVFANTEKLNTYALLEGEHLQNESELLINKDYSVHHNIHVGDMLELFGKAFKVAGIAVKSDYLFPLKDTADVGLNKDKFGVAIVMPSALTSQNALKSYYAVKYTKKDNTGFRKHIAEKYEPVNYVLATSNRRIQYPATMGNEILSNTSSIIPFMFLMVMLIVAIVLGRMVRKEQRQIGALSALGYRRNELIKHYACYAVFPALLGSAGGVLVSFLILKPACLYFANNMEQLNFKISVPFASIIISLLVPAVLYALTAYLTVQKMMKQNTVLLLSGTAGTKNSIRKIFVHSKMKFAYKFQIRSLLKNKMRSIVVLIGICFGSLLIMTGFVALDSAKYMIHSRIDASGKYNYEYYLNEYQTDESIQGEKILAARFEVTGYNALLLMTGVRKDSEYLNWKTISGKPIDPSKYYITNVGAEYYGIKAGDKLTFHNPISMEEHTIAITDILDDNTRSILYTSAVNVAQLLQVPDNYFNIIQTNDKLDIPQENIIMFSSKDLIKEQLEKLISTVYSLLGAVIFFGILLSMISTYLTVNMVVEENQNNISMLKVLGYRPKEINRLVLNINHILFVIAFVISIPLSKIMAAMIFRGNIESMGNYIQPVVTFPSVLYSLLILSFSYLGSLFLLKRKVFKVNMVESLKNSRE